LPHNPYAKYKVWSPYRGQLGMGSLVSYSGTAKVFSVLQMVQRSSVPQPAFYSMDAGELPRR